MIATTRGALLRGETTNALGDEVDALTIVEILDDEGELVRAFDDFPASIIEKSRNEFDQASNTWRTVRYYAGRVPSDVPVRAGDRIRDNRDGSLFGVVEVESMARGLSGRASTTLTMRRAAP